VAVLLGRGDGTFQPATYYSIDSQVESVESLTVADFNHDGNLDIAVADRLATSVYVLLGNGDGTFQPPTPFPTIGYPFFVTGGDFNGDHIPDLITADDLCQCMSVLLGNGDGTFQPPIRTNPGYVPPTAIAVGDFNLDGKLDLAAAGQRFTNSEVEILLGNGDGTFQTGASYTVGSLPQSIAVADFRGNGKLELAVADSEGGR
jgi:VCBS repeat protein